MEFIISVASIKIDENELTLPQKLFVISKPTSITHDVGAAQRVIQLVEGICVAVF